MGGGPHRYTVDVTVVQVLGADQAHDVALVGRRAVRVGDAVLPGEPLDAAGQFVEGLEADEVGIGAHPVDEVDGSGGAVGFLLAQDRQDRGEPGATGQQQHRTLGLPEEELPLGPVNEIASPTAARSAR